MKSKLQPLPFRPDSMTPFLSERAILVHYEEHQKKYADQLKELILGTEFETYSLEKIIQSTVNSNEKIYNNAAQLWSHTFFWKGLTSTKDFQPPSTWLRLRLADAFDDLGGFKSLFTKSGLSVFGSGWVWLVSDPDGHLLVQTYQNADCPLNHNLNPVLVCDMWEHSYYLDYQSQRSSYLESFWKSVNWPQIEANITGKQVQKLYRPKEPLWAGE